MKGMALNALKYIFISSRETGGGAAVSTFPEHIRSVILTLTEKCPEARFRCYYSGAYSVTFPCLPFIFVLHTQKDKDRRIWQGK